MVLLNVWVLSEALPLLVALSGCRLRARLWLRASRASAPQYILELRLLLLELLELLMHLLLILKSLEGGHLVCIWNLAHNLVVTSLHKNLLGHLLHSVGVHLLLANHNPLAVVYSRHIDDLGLELIRAVAPIRSLLLAGALAPR